MKTFLQTQLYAFCAALIAIIHFDVLYRLTENELFSKAPYIYLVSFGPFLGLGLLYFFVARKWFYRKWVMLVLVLPVSYLIYVLLLVNVHSFIIPMEKDDFGAGILLLFVQSFTIFTLFFASIIGGLLKKRRMVTELEQAS